MRLAVAGHEVLIGSRTAHRAHETVSAIRVAAPTARADGMENAAACEQADIVVIVVPYSAQRPLLDALAPVIGNKVVVNCVNSLGFDAAGPYPVPVSTGSAAEECQLVLRSARVVGAWQNVSAVKLNRPDEPVDVDVLLTGDDDSAREIVAGLVEGIPGMRAVHAGPLRLTRPIEEITAVLISVNKRYRTQAGVRIAGLP